MAGWHRDCFLCSTGGSKEACPLSSKRFAALRPSIVPVPHHAAMGKKSRVDRNTKKRSLPLFHHPSKGAEARRSLLETIIKVLLQ
jgi:hypothetical protein